VWLDGGGGGVELTRGQWMGHNALERHLLLLISHHFRDYKSTVVKSRV